MSELAPCQVCGTLNQQVGKYCEQCGSRVELPADVVVNTPPPDPVSTPPPPDPVPDPAAAPTADVGNASGMALAAGEARFILVEGGMLDTARNFTVPPNSKLLLGRMDLSSDPARRTVPEVDLTPWAKRVQTSEGPLYTIHRRQCYILRDADGIIRIVDYPDYPGDTFVNPTGTADYKTIPDLAKERSVNAEGAVELRSGDRILMGQGEGMLTFQLVIS